MDFLKNCNILALKFSSPAHAGVPDLVCIGEHGVFFLELKNPNGRGRLSKLQAKTIEKMEGYGAEVHVIDNLERLDEIVQTFQAADKGRPDTKTVALH